MDKSLLTNEQRAAVAEADRVFYAAKRKALRLESVYLAGQAIAKARAERDDAYCIALGIEPPRRTEEDGPAA